MATAMTREQLSKLSTDELKKLVDQLPNQPQPGTHPLATAGAAVNRWTEGAAVAFADGWKRERSIRKLTR